MPALCLLFRKPTDHFFSIERIFNQLGAAMGKQFETQKAILPQYTSSLGAIRENLKYTRSLKADVFHVTGDVHYAVLALPRKRTLLTIHDCVFLHRYTGIKRLLLKWLLLDLPVRRCRMITTISENSKKEIISATGCSPDKIRVIPNPIPELIRREPKDFNETEPVLLFIGITPNKNLPRTIQALEGFRCVLNIIGPLSDEVKVLLEKHAIKYTNSYNLSDQELAEQYRKADIVLFPSTYEGFGMPIIEGQQTGRPVITSNLSPMKDVAGEGACLINPYDQEAIRDAVTKVAADRQYREQLIEKGFQNVSRYSAAAIASTYESCYQELIES
ncbi:MAG: glycosyltransferase family 4 protein [Bacteroidetes bacterium]|nr:glycosyltransferase family 4 protein [Bacteroidota bacterium]